MAKKVFTDESLSTFVDEIKAYTDEAVSTKMNAGHSHSASDITSGTLTIARLPTIPISKGGTGASTPEAALANLGLTATAAELNKLDGVTATTAELNYVDGVTSAIQTQLNGKVPTSRTINGKALSSNITLSASDVNALPNTAKIPTKTSELTNDSNFITAADVNVDSIDASKITSGTLSSDRLPTAPIIKGGTGATTADAARTNLGAAPAYQYSSTDLIAGTSSLTTGTLYFVYE
jgi:hypothetical protein